VYPGGLHHPAGRTEAITLGEDGSRRPHPDSAEPIQRGNRYEGQEGPRGSRGAARRRLGARSSGRLLHPQRNIRLIIPRSDFRRPIPGVGDGHCISSNRWRPVVQLHWDWHALKPQRGLRPVAGQSQELSSLLFGPSPSRPTGGNHERFCDIRRPWTCPPPLMVSGAQPVSQPPRGWSKTMRLSPLK